MSKLTDDMQKALDGLALNDPDKKFLEDILYLERINKTKEWSADATRSIKELLNNADLDGLNE